MDEFAAEIGVEMHGVSVNVRANDAVWLDHTATLLGEHAGPSASSPQLIVTGEWRSAKAGEPVEDFFDVSHLEQFGKRMHVGQNEVVWNDTYRDKDLQLRFRREGDVYAFDVGYFYRPSEKKLSKYPNYQQKKFFDLLRYMVFFPIAWHLERSRGWMMIHASVVRSDDRAVLVAGPGGCGKTTTAVALVARAGMNLVTENLVFWDGEQVYPAWEPIRLTDESLALLGDATSGLQPFDLPGGLKRKTLFHLPVPTTDQAVRPALLLIPHFASKAYAEPLGAGEASEWLGAANRLTLELDDYNWYTAALDLIWLQTKVWPCWVTPPRGFNLLIFQAD